MSTVCRQRGCSLPAGSCEQCQRKAPGPKPVGEVLSRRERAKQSMPDELRAQNPADFIDQVTRGDWDGYEIGQALVEWRKAEEEKARKRAAWYEAQGAERRGF